MSEANDVHTRKVRLEQLRICSSFTLRGVRRERCSPKVAGLIKALGGAGTGCQRPDNSDSIFER